MTSEQINEEIAKACGWECSENGWWSHPVIPDGGGAEPYAPDYCNDLNEMHIAENILNEDQIDSYVYRLMDDKTGLLRGCVYEPSIFACLHSTPRKRAEAFLMTIGKWKEGND